MPPLPRWISVLRSPSFGLFLGLFALVIAAFAGYALLVDQATERQWRGSVESGALAWTGLIRHVTRHSMLLVNAIEAMPEGGTLTVAVLPRAGEVEVSVADTGIGIPPEALPRIYEPFFTTKEGKVGAGLGLSVVYGIVERHGGRIDVESGLGKGTAFRLTLPRQRRQDP